MTENDKLLNILSNNMKSLRNQLGISQMDLSNKCEISQSFIGEIESMRKSPSLKMISIISKALNVEPYELLLSEKMKMNTDNSYLVDKIEKELKNKIVSNYEDFFIDIKKKIK